MNPLSRLMKKQKEQKKVRALPPWIRRRIYNELLTVIEEEREMKRLLDLPVGPRLSLVDEQRLVVLHPGDREHYGLDQIMRKVIREHLQAEKEDEDKKDDETAADNSEDSSQKPNYGSS